MLTHAQLLLQLVSYRAAIQTDTSQPMGMHKLIPSHIQGYICLRYKRTSGYFGLSRFTVKLPSSLRKKKIKAIKTSADLIININLLSVERFALFRIVS